MGQHCWLLIATIATELLAITKWSRGQFPEPLPKKVKYAWSLGATLLVLYPTIAVRIRHFLPSLLVGFRKSLSQIADTPWP